MLRTTTSCSRQPSSSLLTEISFLHPKTCPVQVVPLVPQGWYYISFLLFRVTGSSKQHSSTSRVVGYLGALFYGGINRTNKACMFFLSQWTHQTLGHKKYCVLRKYAGATKGPKGPTRLIKNYWCYAIAGWAGWGKVGTLAFLSGSKGSLGCLSALSMNLRIMLGCRGFCSCSWQSFALSFKSVCPSAKSSWEWSKGSVSTVCPVRFGALWGIQHFAGAVQQPRRSHFTAEKFKSKESSGLSFYGLNR